MFHMAGMTPEAEGAVASDADWVTITVADMAATWSSLNGGPAAIDLVAFGSPHASFDECRAIVDAFGESRRRDHVQVIVTAGTDVIRRLRQEGVLQLLQNISIKVLPDLCWCSISEPY